MSLDTQSHKSLPKEPLSTIRIELWANRDEFSKLSSEFDSLENVYYKGHLAYPSFEGEKLSKEGKAAFYAPPPYEVYFQIIFTISSIATVVDILYRHMKKGNKGKNEVKFIFNGNEMVLKGDYNKDKIELIVKEFSKVATISELEAVSKYRKEQLKNELEGIETHLPTYEKLVEIGNEKISKGEKINTEQHNHYIKELEEMRIRKKIIEELLEI